MSSPASPTTFPIPFVAPVPRGNAVSIFAFRRTPDGVDEASVVVDRTFGLVYADSTLAGALGASPTAVDDPVAAITRFSWAVTKHVTGISSGALVAYTPARTVLFLVPEDSPYRG
jgi:hypothetical protein